MTTLPTNTTLELLAKEMVARNLSKVEVMHLVAAFVNDVFGDFPLDERKALGWELLNDLTELANR